MNFERLALQERAVRVRVHGLLGPDLFQVVRRQRSVGIVAVARRVLVRHLTRTRCFQLAAAGPTGRDVLEHGQRFWVPGLDLEHLVDQRFGLREIAAIELQ